MAISDLTLKRYKKAMKTMLKDSPSSFNDYNKQIIKCLRDSCLAKGHTYEELGRLELQALREVKKELQDGSYLN